MPITATFYFDRTNIEPITITFPQKPNMIFSKINRKNLASPTRCTIDIPDDYVFDSLVQFEKWKRDIRNIMK